jgi:hypothetical protein
MTRSCRKVHKASIRGENPYVTYSSRNSDGFRWSSSRCISKYCILQHVSHSILKAESVKPYCPSTSCELCNASVRSDEL